MIPELIAKALRISEAGAFREACLLHGIQMSSLALLVAHARQLGAATSSNSVPRFHSRSSAHACVACKYFCAAVESKPLIAARWPWQSNGPWQLGSRGFMRQDFGARSPSKRRRMAFMSQKRMAMRKDQPCPVPFATAMLGTASCELLAISHAHSHATGA